jgi:ABC-type amino acid transport substrate-binding protein
MIYSGLSITPARAKLITFSISYLALDQGIVVKKELGTTMEQFGSGDFIIGAQRSTTGAQYLESDYFGTEMYNPLVQSGKIKLYVLFHSPWSLLSRELLMRLFSTI